MINWNETFVYNEESPSCLSWKKHGRFESKNGSHITHMNDSGYYQVRVAGRLWRAHRIIWEMHNGPIPDGFQIDHKDTNRANNKLENLRISTNSQNCSNRNGNQKQESSKYKGASWRPDKKKWRSYIVLNQKQYNLGHYDQEISAAYAYDWAAKYYFGEFARLNFPNGIYEVASSL